MNVIRIYGVIAAGSENSAERIVSGIEHFELYEEPVVIALHCDGGSVIEGNMIGQAIAKAGATIRIDGLAASMGAFLLPYAREVQMVDNGFIMLHEPRVSVGGTSEELKKSIRQIESITADFVKRLMAKTGREEKEVRKWLDGDNWFTAAEAKAMGLVDEIIPAIEGVQVFDAKAGRKEIFSRFSAVLNNSNLNNQMDKRSIIAQMELSGVTDSSSDADVILALKAKIQAERDARLAAEQAVADIGKKEIDSVVAQAIAEKKIPADKRDTFVAIGTGAGVESLREALAAITRPAQAQKRTPVSDWLAQGGVPAGKFAGSWDELDKKDLLLALKAEQPDLYQEKFAEKFGK
jgi:ATP-dependent protease ClpP protease subunit